MRNLILAITATLLAAAGAAQAEAPPAAQAETAQPAKYSTNSTQLGTLFADPAAKAVLEKHIPDLASNDDILERASGMTLAELNDAIKNYSPEVLSDKVRAAIDADLAQIK